LQSSYSRRSLLLKSFSPTVISWGGSAVPYWSSGEFGCLRL